jgi:flagellar biosynthesis/type III secretory pathway chaperone
MQNYEAETNEKHLYRFNELLIDVIEKIQTQNKKNQLFINKAILSLREIREDAGGVKKYNTYSAKGISKSRSAD